MTEALFKCTAALRIQTRPHSPLEDYILPKDPETVQRSRTPSKREQASAIAEEVVEICHVFNKHGGVKIGQTRT
jgi:hypothetical protein